MKKPWWEARLIDLSIEIAVAIFITTFTPILYGIYLFPAVRRELIILVWGYGGDVVDALEAAIKSFFSDGSGISREEITY